MNTDFLNFISALKEKASIADIIEKYVPLVRHGGGIWARCPFHSEKTPSFKINEEGFYKCFGCGKGGDVIRFIMEYEKLDFTDAVKKLCDLTGTEFPEFAADREGQGNASLDKAAKDRLLSLMKDAARFYHNSLNEKDKGAEILKYLTGRGITNEYIKKFGLGFSPDFYGVINRLKELNYTEEEIINSGVGATNDQGWLFDSLGTRLIVPIINRFDDVVAFGGRDMSGESAAKYKNTRETPLFKKNKTLFGINAVKAAARKSGTKGNGIILVEGYFDVIALHQAGFTTAAASMGTSLTPEQAKLIKSFTNDVFICYDGDVAGKTSTLRGLDILRDAGLSVKVVGLPEGLDPDEYIERCGTAGFKTLLESAPVLSVFKMNVSCEGLDLNKLEHRRKYTAAAIKVIAEEKSGAAKEDLLKTLGKNLNMSLDVLRKDLEVFISESEKTIDAPKEGGKPIESSRQKAVKFILYGALKNASYASDISFVYRHLEETAHKEIFNIIESAEGGRVNISAHIGEENGKISDELINILSGGDLIDPALAKKYFEDCKRLLLGNTETDLRLEQLKARYDTETDLDKRKKIAMEIQLLIREKVKGKK